MAASRRERSLTPPSPERPLSGSPARRGYVWDGAGSVWADAPRMISGALPGEHRFQIGLPFRPERSGLPRVVVE
jgi:hypothetical protein